MIHASYVTVGVPIYRGGDVIEESLRSIQQQSHREIKVIISLDGPQPESEEVCRPFLKDPRFQIIVQPERLGWVGNTNYLISRVETPYWMWHAQDDILDPRCVATLLEHAERNPAAAVVYSDIQCFGLRNDTLIQSSVTGDAVSRQLTLIREHLSAVAFRGLTRLEALRFCGRIPFSTHDAFAPDTVWMAALARWGELQRVPQSLYRKRLHAESEHARWSAWPAEARRRAWIAHCADMLAEAMLVPATADQRYELWLAMLQRLTARQWSGFYRTTAEWRAADAASLLHEFFEYLRARPEIDVSSWLEDRWAGAENAAGDLPLAREHLLGREGELTDHDVELASRDRELTEIRASKAWRLTLAIRRIRLALAPPNSWRERTLRAASRILGRAVS